MKIQDVVFIIVAAYLLYKRNPMWLILGGALSLLLAIPLFATWTFFTAQRLTWYGAGFFLFACIVTFIQNRKDR